MKKQSNLRNLCLSAMFLAIAFVLPFFTGQIPQIGNMLCPMHFPVMLTGFICGAPWGAVVGFIAPLLRSLIVGSPELFPRAVIMAFELCTYGLLCGILYKVFPKKKGYIYLSLISSMLGGRLVWGALRFFFMGLGKSEFSLALFWSGGFVEAIPAIIIQLLLIPVIVMLVQKTKANE